MCFWHQFWLHRAEQCLYLLPSMWWGQAGQAVAVPPRGDLLGTDPSPMGSPSGCCANLIKAKLSSVSSLKHHQSKIGQ